jgi:3-phenylpropionate/trans-cinnamate dioxygenase ferredoxin reductase component
MAMRVVIVGAGQAGGWVAKTLLDEGFAGEVVLLGDEAHPPHERPPLSKDVLLGKKPPESTYLWPAGLGVDFRPRTRVVRVDRAEARVVLDDGSTLGYDRLVLATGARVRRLDIPGARYLRTIEDSLSLYEAFSRGWRVLVVGGGWIGLEAAAAARQLGCEVTLVELATRLCSRVVPEVLSDYLLALHRLHGVDVRLGTSEPVDAETVVVGIGVTPNDELAAEAGLEAKAGILVDEYGRTSDPAIYAAGDVAVLDGVRLESWANAQNQAIAAAKSILGKDEPYREIPWFWSDQYDMNLQLLGLPAPHHRTVLRGSPASGKFVVFFHDNDRLASVAAINNGRDLRIAKRLMESSRTFDDAVLADESRPLQALLRG